MFCVCSCVGSEWEAVLDARLQYACHSVQLNRTDYVGNEYLSGIACIMLCVHDIDAAHHQYTYFRFPFNLCQSVNVFLYMLLAV